MAHSRPAPAPGVAPWLRRLRLRHLEVLLAISRHGSLTAAAVALHMTQPGVSQWLADMERAVGVRLFIRGRRLQQTPHAAPLLRHAERVLGDVRRTHEELESVSAGALGRVRVGTMLVAATVLVPRMAVRLHCEAPTLNLVVVEDIMAGLWPRLERNELDVLVGRLDRRILGSGLPNEALYEDAHCVVAAPDHPLARRRRIAWRDVATAQWVLPPGSTPLREAFDATFMQAKLTPPRATVESGSPTATLAILRAGDRLGVVSRTAARYYRDLGMLGILPLELTARIGPVGMVWNVDSPGPALARVLAALRVEGRAIAAQRR